MSWGLHVSLGPPSWFVGFKCISGTWTINIHFSVTVVTIVMVKYFVKGMRSCLSRSLKVKGARSHLGGRGGLSGDYSCVPRVTSEGGTR